jgi:DNA-binding response OmpR family regulator
MASRKAPVKTILIVDDDPDIGEALELAMSVEGYSVRVAKNHDEGLALLRQIQPAVVLLDYYGLGGDPGQFVAKAEALSHGVRIVLMTSARTATVRARDLGLGHVLAKPFDIETLLRIVNALDSDDSGKPGPGPMART